MSRLILLTSCIIIIISSLCTREGGVMAFIPSKSSTSSSFGYNGNNLPQLLLKGSSSNNKHTAVSIQQQGIHHPTRTFKSAYKLLSASSNDSNNEGDSPTNKSSHQKRISSNSTKKRKMSISKQSLTSAQKSTSSSSTTLNQPQQTQQDEEQRAYNDLLPKTGYSLADSLEQSEDNVELFQTILTPIGGVSSIGSMSGGLWNDGGEEEEFEYDADGFPVAVKKKKKKGEDQLMDNNKEQQQDEDNGVGHDGIARIDTISNYGGREPVRWIVSLDDPNKNGNDAVSSSKSHVMIDLPPYSDKLANEIRQFMNPNSNTTSSSTKQQQQQREGTLDAILLTNQQCIHYDNTPGVYVTRKSDLTKWKHAFPDAKIVMYRLDVPRECRPEMNQVLDGYGPWGWREDHHPTENDNEEGRVFVETGRPLTIEEWDEDTKSRVLENGELPPEDEGMLDDDDGEEEGESTDVVATDDDEDEDAMYSQEAIRQREEQYRLLAVYTPGHTFGSVTYIFPKRGLCCSGFALPLESSSSVMDGFDDDDEEDNDDSDRFGNRSSAGGSTTPIGPRLDYQGYLATSASRPRQMSSALSLINRYIDRFRVVLPARGDIVFLDASEEKRKRDLLASVGLYRKMSDIYSRLGIVG